MISVRCLIPRLVILQNHSSLTTKKLVKPNEFGSLGHIDVPLERLTNTQRVSEYDSHRYQQKLKEIRYPVNQSRKTTQRLEKQQYLNSVSNRNILIECSQPEFNHHEGMIYPRGLDIPLCSEFWHKNKYKNHWFIVKRKTKNAFYFSRNNLEWEDFIPDQLDVRLKDSILKLGFKMPTSTQSECLQAFSSVNHLFIAAETGSGKTLAYAVPLMSVLLKNKIRNPSERVIVMAVTTSLKEQIYNVLSKISVGTPLNIKICKQGEDDKPNNWDILVGTPGLIEKYILSLEHPSEVSHIVMDEADMLLDESFTEVLTNIFSVVPVANSITNPVNKDTGARIIFCSASCPEELECLAEGIVDRASLSYVKSPKLHTLLPNLEMKFIRLREMDKLDKLKQLLDNDLKMGSKNQTLVFCKDRKTAHFVKEKLNLLGSNVELWNKDAPPECSRVFIATDIAARGVDLPLLSHIINYDLARHSVDFLHRCGRVGRLSSNFPGRVTSFIRTTSEVRLVNAIELSARLNRPLPRIETDISSLISNRSKVVNDG